MTPSAAVAFLLTALGIPLFRHITYTYRRFHPRFRRPGLLLVWDTVDSTREHSAVSRVRFAPGVTVSRQGPAEATVSTGGRRFAFRAFGGELFAEPGYYAPHFGKRLPVEVLALRKGPGRDFGYALSDRDVPVSIGPNGATVGGEAVHRWPRGAGQ